MKRLFMLGLSLVLCTIIVVGFMSWTKQAAGADNGTYGKYVFPEDPSTYIELRPDGSCLFVARVYGPSGKPTDKISTVKGTYEIKGDIVTIKLISSNSSKYDIVDFRLEGNALVTIKTKSGKGRDGLKLIKSN